MRPKASLVKRQFHQQSHKTIPIKTSLNPYSTYYKRKKRKRALSKAALFSVIRR